MVKDRSASNEQLAFLFKTFADIPEPDRIEALMIDLCTIREINEMATRLDVARLLAKGESYLKIQENTGSSATTIARVSKCINHGSGGYRSVFGLDLGATRADRFGGIVTSVAAGEADRGDGNPNVPSTPATGGR